MPPDVEYVEALIMKQISGIGSSAVTDTQPAWTARASVTSTSTTQLAVTKTTTAAASAQLSNVGRLMQQNAGADDARYEKVAAIQAAIAGGAYSVPASVVADKLMESMFG